MPDQAWHDDSRHCGLVLDTHLILREQATVACFHVGFTVHIMLGNNKEDERDEEKSPLNWSLG